MSAITAANATGNHAAAVVTRAIGRHRESATRWIFVVTPPRLRPKPSRSGTTRDLPDFEQVYDNRLTTLPGVQRLSSTLVMKSIAENRPLAF